MVSEKKLALITGASSGIGADLAHLCASAGYDVALVARSEENLQKVKASLASDFMSSTFVIPADLSKKGSVHEIMQTLHREACRPLDILINNAGSGSFGPFAESDITVDLDMIELNVASLVELTHRCLGPMQQRKSGKIMNVASTAAFQPGPLMAVYYATKAFVLSFSEALSNELEGSGITVTALCPGPTKTGFQAAAGMQRSKLLQGPLVMASKDVAKAGFNGMMKGKTIVVPGFTNKVTTQSMRFLPRRWVVQIVRKLQETIER